ncbi:battenin isoform X1 [Biomphalaria glabrata]|uniref:Battenin n=1 Tax=Biomphalaria glabrata TaxID=6526 RepID=A0A2C9KRX0_BIOGL|nr:battenin isoform X1 [Biomphalaria glabrata]
MQLRNWVCLFLMGAINNLPYVIVNSAASTIADRFNHSDLVGVVFGANVSLSVFVKSLNTFLLLKVSYTLRYIVNGCIMLLGLFGISYAFNFAFAIVCIAVVGSSSAFGENVTLGFLTRYPSSLVNAWASGTGMAGLLGASIFIIFGCSVGDENDQNQEKSDKLQQLNKWAFLLTTPVVLIYWAAYFFMVKTPDASNDAMPGKQQETSGYTTNYTEPKLIARVIEDADQLVQGQVQGEMSKNTTTLLLKKESGCGKFWRCFKLVLWLGLNLSGVYVFEYVARGCAAKVRPSKEYNVGCPELYASLQLCYQAGVFVSRSSVQMFRIRKVEILTVLQLLNMLLWIVDVHYKFIPVAALPALMVYVGLLGGASYVNIFFALLNDEKFPKEDRELCVNIVGLFINLGIVIGTGLETALFTTILK